MWPWPWGHNDNAHLESETRALQQGRIHDILLPTNCLGSASQYTSPVSEYSAGGMLFHCSELCLWQELLTISVLGTCPQARPWFQGHFKLILPGTVTEGRGLDPMQQHKSYCGHKQNAAGTQWRMQTKNCFPSFWSSCAAVWVVVLTLYRERSNVEK